jgi:signal peptidase I
MEEQSSRNSWKELAKLIVFSIIIAGIFRTFIAQPFIVDGASMDPTFRSGEYLIVDELTYYFKEPERGSVLIFKYPQNPKKYFIKRIIGLPREIISIKNGVVTIKNDENPNGFVLKEPYVKFQKDEDLIFTLIDNQYFVMGDNRRASLDSRAWGAVPVENIIGRPVIRLLPPTLLPGKIEQFKN